MRGTKTTLTAGLLALFVAACSATTASPSPTTPVPTDGGQPAPSMAPSASAPPVSEPPSGVPSPTAVASATPGASAEPTATPVSPGGEFAPDTIRLVIEPFADGFKPLTLLTHAGDGSGQVYIVEQPGMIWTLPAQGDGSPDQFLSIGERIKSGGEQGLLGLAFHPDYATNGRFFVNYTAEGTGATVVSEFVRSADRRGDPASERVVLTVEQPFGNHNGGMLAFGPDGYLYIGLGDGGSADDPQGNGQRLNTLLGKILRIDVDGQEPYGIPADNPFVGVDARPEIWSYGLRNPWRFSFDRLTHGMFIGDVGQNTREEVDAEPAGVGGRNYGWNIVEGDRCLLRSPCAQQGLTPPVVAYGRDGNCSVTGGYVYRGARFPNLYGGYVFSDYCSGILWGIDAEAALERGTARIVELGDTPLNPSSFGEDEAGELYIVHASGSVHRIVAVPR